MFIWSGYGFLVPVFGFGSAILTEYLSERWAQDAHYYQNHKWLILVGMALAGLLTYGLDRLLKLRKAKVVIDKETGKEITLHYPHSFFFVPLKAWPFVFIVIGIILQFVDVDSPRPKP